MPMIAANIRAAQRSALDVTVSAKDLVPHASRNRRRNSSKRDLVIAGLSANDGVTIADLCDATGWRAHSCRAFFTGLRKSGQPVERIKRPDGTTVYKLAEGEGAGA
ncbi:MAG: DUF3489 domain-containing protein [Sandaracinobacter sp.]